MESKIDLASPVINSEHSWFRVGDYVGWQRDGSLQLRPKFQRGSVWKPSDKSLLIDSLLKGFPVPLIILQDEYPAIGATSIRRVVDGQQRLRTLISYIDRSLLGNGIEDSDDFTYRPPGVHHKHPGYQFVDLSRDQQMQIIETRISAVILNSRTSEPAVLEVYDRLNRTGTKLSAQELRWAKFRSNFSELCYGITRDNQTRWQDWGIITNQAIAQMGDVELTSELVLLIIDGVQKTGKRELDGAFENIDLTEYQQNYIVQVFNSVFESLAFVYDSAQSPDTIRAFRSKAWLYSLFSYQLYLMGVIDKEGDVTAAGRSYRLGDLTPPDVSPTWIEAALEAYKDARKSDASLTRAVSGGASDRSSRKTRLNFLTSTLSR